MFIEHSTKLLLGFRAFETAPGGMHGIATIAQLPKRTRKRGPARSEPADLPALPLLEADEQCSSVAKVNKWIALADIALGQGIGRKIA
jgi:hypothetical protein